MLPESAKLMRDTGSKTLQSGFFELDLTNGVVTWANDYLMKSCVQYGPRLIGASVHAIVRESHRERLLESLSEASSGRLFTRTVWPVLSNDGKTTWWTVVLEGAKNHTLWFSCSVSASVDTGSDMDMIAAMVADSHFVSAISSSKSAELEQKVYAEIEKTRKHMTSTVQAVTTAANAALENKQATAELRSSMAKQFEDMTTEILRLISADARLSHSDAIHEEKMKVFEDRVKKITTIAVKSIVNRADEAGRGLSKRVTIPVSLIAAAVTFLQWLINNWPKHGQLSSILALRKRSSRNFEH